MASALIKSENCAIGFQSRGTWSRRTCCFPSWLSHSISETKSLFILFQWCFFFFHSFLIASREKLNFEKKLNSITHRHPLTTMSSTKCEFFIRLKWGNKKTKSWNSRNDVNRLWSNRYRSTESSFPTFTRKKGKKNDGCSAVLQKKNR
jgi:hypothetical protein